MASNWMQEGDGAYGTGAGLCVLYSRRKPGISAGGGRGGRGAGGGANLSEICILTILGRV